MFTQSKITRRWLRNSFGVIVAIILLASIVLSVMVRRYYYDQISQTLETEAVLIANSFQQYAKESSGNFDEKLRNYVTNFEKRDEMELMIIAFNGQTEITSSGFLPEVKAMPDYLKAIQNETGIGMEIGSLSSGGEKSMMLSLLYPVREEANILAVRLATSLTNADKQIFTIVLTIFSIAIITLGLVLFSSYYFISSIVRPIGKVGETARKIAQGDFDARLNFKYDDEIGELATIINYMADELSNTEKMKNDFISSVSHELRTPLTAIQGWGETIKLDEGKDKELLDKGMSVIIGETARLTVMVEELLDFSRIQNNRLKLIKTSVNPFVELSEAAFMYTQKARRDGIQLEYYPSEEQVMVYADKNRLRQVFINIIDNAIKYSDKGDKIIITEEIIKNQVIIKVTDTGIGISKEDLPKITTKFYKADSTRRGSGIGLAVAEEIIRNHEGTLIINSLKDEGTSITITLPIHKGEEHLTVEGISGNQN